VAQTDGRAWEVVAGAGVGVGDAVVRQTGGGQWSV